MNTVTLIEDGEKFYLITDKVREVTKDIADLFISTNGVSIEWHEVEAHYLVFEKGNDLLVIKSNNDLICYAEKVTVIINAGQRVVPKIKLMWSFYKANIWLVTYDDRWK